MLLLPEVTECFLSMFIIFFFMQSMCTVTKCCVYGMYSIYKPKSGTACKISMRSRTVDSSVPKVILKSHHIKYQAGDGWSGCNSICLVFVGDMYSLYCIYCHLYTVISAPYTVHGRIGLYGELQTIFIQCIVLSIALNKGEEKFTNW